MVDFYWSVPNDGNRIEDGLKLRELFMQRHDFFVLDFPCSVLEVLIGLALRMEDNLADPSKGDRTAEWFWEMIANLGLDQFHDQNYQEAGGDTNVGYILRTFMDRTYTRRGEGSLFPSSRRSGRNLQRVELWYQLMAYLEENYAD